MSLREKFEENEVEEMECCCPRCEIIDEYTEMILDAKNEEEIRDFLEEMFDEVEDFGFANALKCDIDMKLDVLKDMGELEDE